VAWGRWWAAPHPRAGAGVELQGRHRGGQGDFGLTFPDALRRAQGQRCTARYAAAEQLDALVGPTYARF
jgi:hypothetical protein